MDNEITKINSSDIYAESQTDKIQNKSTKHKKKIKTIVIILLIPTIMVYCLLLFVGAAPIPRLCIIANFYLNKNHFERVVNSDFDYINAYSDGVAPYISKTDDEELQKSMRAIFKGMWRRMAYDDYQQIHFFFPFNFSYAKARGILYYEGSRENLRLCEGDLEYMYRCYSLGDGWYYYEAAYKIKG